MKDYPFWTGLLAHGVVLLFAAGASSAAPVSITALQMVPAAASGETLVVVSGTPTIQFVDAGYGYRDHDTSIRHAGEPMPLSLIPGEERRQLEQSLLQQATEAAVESLSMALPAARPATLPGDKCATNDVLDRNLHSWSGLTSARDLRELFEAPGVSRVAVVRVDSVAHETGWFLMHKISPHYVCADAAVEGRLALPDGRLLPLHLAKVCHADLFHPGHRESVAETSERQAAALHDAFHLLSKRLANGR